MKVLFSIFILVTIGSLHSCVKDCSQTEYAFEGHFTASPDRETLRIGDTLWLELEMPTRLTNQMNNEEIYYSGAENLGTAINHIELKGGDRLNSNSVAAANAFDHVLKKGSMVPSIDPNSIREYLFVEEAGFYRFKVGIVPKKKGLFAISPSNAEGVFTQKNKCDKAGFNLSFANTNQHLYLYEQNRPGYILGSYEREHMYCFKVE